MLRHILAPGDPRRLRGVVQLDPAKVTVPAAHVLVIGVAAYRSGQFATVLDTATISARTVADWFLGCTDAACFTNPDCGLGSLAILLSETRDGRQSTYACGEVPRATFEETKAAVRSWLDRIESHKDNLAIVYVASHGESFLGRTAFLLEDYGMDKHDATAGMAEVELLLGSLENATPVAQLLLFDCCRNPMEAMLPWGAPVGSPLITLAKRPGDHGEDRKQWAICATSPGQYATGVKGEQTLFNRALLDALNGVAGDVSSANWPIRPGLLFDKLDRILGLHRLPLEKAQRPSGRMAGSYEISFPGERDQVPVYICVENVDDWVDTTFELSIDGVVQDIFVGREREPPFEKRLLAHGARVAVKAERDGEVIGSAESRLWPPALFLEIARQPPSVIKGALPAGRSAFPTARIIVHLDSLAHLSRGAVVEVIRRSDPAKNPKRVVLDDDGRKEIEVAPGDLAVTMRTPDGRGSTRDVTVAADEIVTLMFAPEPTSHQWLGVATAVGAIKPQGTDSTASPRSDGDATVEDPVHPSVRQVGRSTVITFGSDDADFEDDEADFDDAEPLLRPIDAILGGTRGDAGVGSQELGHRSKTPPSVIDAKVVGFVDIALGVTQGSALQLATKNDDGRFVRLDIALDDGTAGDFRRGIRPSFLSVSAAGRRELAVLPCVRPGKGENLRWAPFAVVDRQAPADRHAVAVMVEDPEWASLLGFLGARDMASAFALLDDGMEQAAVHALEEKASNPLAAAAGALVAVSNASADVAMHWDPWLENLANRFPGLPDGAVILGRRLLSKARTEVDILAAKGWFVEAARRGVPVYSLSVDWLARGLESTAGDDADLVAVRASARRLANRVDSGHIFTVIRADL